MTLTLFTQNHDARGDMSVYQTGALTVTARISLS